MTAAATGLPGPTADQERAMIDFAEEFRDRLEARRWDGVGELLGDARVWRFDHWEETAELARGLDRHFRDSIHLELRYLARARPQRVGDELVLRAEGRFTWAEPYLLAAADWVLGMVFVFAGTAEGGLRPTGLSLSRDTKIHAGCGPGSFFPRLLKGWINLDLRFDHPELGRVDLLAEWPFADGSAAAVYSEDFIEHLGQQQQLLYFGEALRVLQPGGLLRTVCPGLCEESVRRRLFPRWPQTGIAHADPSAEWPQWGHVLMPTWDYLAEVLRLVGFTDVRRLGKGESHVPGFPGDKRPLDDREEEDQLYVEAMKPWPVPEAGRR